MSFMEYPQRDACRALMPEADPAPPGPPSRPMVCHMPAGHDGPHALTRRPRTMDRRWEGDARPVTASTPQPDDRNHYESHTWDDESCIVCGVSWTDCDDVCPSAPSEPPTAAQEACPVCGHAIDAEHKTPSMAHGPCTFTDGGARCVFGPMHAIGYHHLDDDRNVPTPPAAAPVPDAPVTNSADVRLRTELPWIDYDHRCDHRAAAADRKLYADEFHNRYRETLAELERVRAEVLAVHYAVETYTQTTYDTKTGEWTQDSLYADDGTLIYAPNHRLHCANCHVDTTWPCPTAQAVGVTA